MNDLLNEFYKINNESYKINSSYQICKFEMNPITSWRGIVHQGYYSKHLRMYCCCNTLQKYNFVSRFIIRFKSTILSRDSYFQDSHYSIQLGMHSNVFFRTGDLDKSIQYFISRTPADGVRSEIRNGGKGGKWFQFPKSTNPGNFRLDFSI